MKAKRVSQNCTEALRGGFRTQGIEKHGSPGHPLVSIITIVLNGEAVIRQTIESVLRQCYDCIEYIVIDGGSADGTIAIVREYGQQIGHWQSEPDRGISDAFNKGIRLARGEVIGLINAGDWYEADAVTRVVQTFLANPEVGVVCGALQFWKGQEKAFLCHSVPQILEREMTVTHPSCFVRAGCYHQFGLFSTDYRLAMDYEILLRFKRQGIRFLVLEYVLANMQHDGVSEANWKKALLETHRARCEQLPDSIYTGKVYLSFLLIKRQLRIVLERLQCDGLIHFYRNRLALVKKNKL